MDLRDYLLARKFGGGSGNGTWGSITGTLSDQTDLQNALNDKANTNAIPTKVSDLTNDSGYLVPSDISFLSEYNNKAYTFYGISIGFKRVGLFVMANGYSGTLTSSVNQTVIGTIDDSRFYPLMTVEILEAANAKRMFIDQNGEIKIASSLSSGSMIRFTVTYIAKDAVPST